LYYGNTITGESEEKTKKSTRKNYAGSVASYNSGRERGDLFDSS